MSNIRATEKQRRLAQLQKRLASPRTQIYGKPTLIVNGYRLPCMQNLGIHRKAVTYWTFLPSQAQAFLADIAASKLHGQYAELAMEVEFT